MPIITKPSPLEKDATGIFSLNKTALALHPIVVASAHFSSPNVWDKIIVKYKSETLGQFESVEFDATLASPEGQFFVSATAEDIFEVEKITIIDKDGAILLIPRANLTVAEFDIDFGYVPPVGAQAVTWNVAGKTGVGTVTTGANGLITKATGGSGYNVNVLSNETITGDGYVEFVITSTTSFPSVVFGLAEVNSPTGSFNNLLIGCFLVTNPGYLEGVITSGDLTVTYGNFLGIGTAQTGNVIKIARVGITYSIQINDGAAYSFTINNTNPLKVSISPYYTNSGVENVTISL